MNALTRILTVTFVVSLVFLSGCDSSLNLEPQDEFASDQVWEDPALVEAYLNAVYRTTGLGYGDPMPTPGVVDEAVNTHGHGDAPVVKSNMTPDNRGIWQAPGWRPPENPPYESTHWPSVYSSIRDLNILLENLPDSESLSAAERDQFLGEAYFLRGFFYHNLMKLYGGVPLLDQPFELGQDLEQYKVPRGSFEETVEFIVNDLDEAASRLSPDPRRHGAATEGAALALKSRVLLYAASDLYDANESPFDMAEVKYTGGNQADRWERARDAAQEVIDLGIYSLEQTSSAEEYHDLLVEGAGSGLIWARYFNEEGGHQHDHSLFVSPNGYNSWSGDTPIQQHVDAYEMADGSEFEWQGADPESADEPVDADNPYENRDPRFYANIHFNGAEWRERPAGIRDRDPRGVIQTGWYEDPDREGLRPGLDTRESGIQEWNGTRSGYNLRKFVDRNVAPDQEQSFNPWIHIRYAEILLNYAEAQYELHGDATTSAGGSMTAKEALDRVRTRVGMPAVPPDGGPNRSFIERIRQERQVELAFEGHRYYDVRRWMTAPDAYQDAKGIRIEGELDPNGELLVDHRYNYKYNVFTVQERGWQDKNYFVPISRDETDKNPKLKQNPGY